MTKIFIAASARHPQKSTIGLPLGPIRLSMIPISTEKTTMPSMFVDPVVEVPGSQIFCVISDKRTLVKRW